MVGIYLVMRDTGDGYGLEIWRPSLRSARRYVEEHPVEQYELVAIERLAWGGSTKSIQQFWYEPEPYTGPVHRVRISRANVPGLAHRVPIECATPAFEAPGLTSDRRWYVEANACCGTNAQHSWEQEYMTCHCGDWQDVVGTPEAIAELVEKFPVKD